MPTAFRRIIYKYLGHAARTGFHSLLHASPSRLHKQSNRRCLSHRPAEQHKKEVGKLSREPCARSARPVLTCWAVTDCRFHGPAQGQAGSFSTGQDRAALRTQGFRSQTAPTEMFSSWLLHPQRTPTAEHRGGFPRDTSSLTLPSLKCLRLCKERY